MKRLCLAAFLNISLVTFVFAAPSSESINQLQRDVIQSGSQSHSLESQVSNLISETDVELTKFEGHNERFYDMRRRIDGIAFDKIDDLPVEALYVVEGEELDELRAILNGYKEQLVERNREVLSYQKDVQDLKQEVKKVQERFYADKQMELKPAPGDEQPKLDINPILEEKEQALIELNSALDDKNRELILMKGELQTVKEQLKDKNNEFGQMIVKFTKQIGELEKIWSEKSEEDQLQYKNLENELKGKNHKIEQLSEEVLNYQELYEKKKASLEQELGQELIRKEEEIEDLRISIEKTAEQKDDDMLNLKESLRRQMDDKEKEISELRKDLLNHQEFFESKVSDLEGKGLRLSHLEDQINIKDQKIVELAEHVHKQDSRIQTASDSAENLSQKLTQMEVKVTSDNKQLKELLKNIKSVKNRLKNHQQRLVEKDGAISALSQRLDSAVKDYHKQRRVKVDSPVVIPGSIAEDPALRDEMVLISKQLQDALVDNRKKEMMLDDLKRQVASYEQRLDKFSQQQAADQVGIAKDMEKVLRENRQKDLMLDDLKRQVDSYEKKLGQLSQQQTIDQVDIAKDLEKVLRENRQKDLILDDLKRQVESYEKRLDKLTTIKEDSFDYSSLVSQLERDLVELQAQVDIERHNFLRSEEDQYILRSEIKDLKRKLADKEEYVQHQKDKFDTHMNQLMEARSVAHEAYTTIEGLNTAVNQISDEMDMMEVIGDRKDHLISNLEQKVEQARNVEVAQTLEIEILEDKVEKFYHDLNEARNTVDKLMVDIQDQQSLSLKQVLQYKSRARESEEKVEELMQDITRREQEVLNLNQQLDHYKKVLEEQKNSKSDRSDVLQNYQMRNYELEQENHELAKALQAKNYSMDMLRTMLEKETGDKLDDQGMFNLVEDKHLELQNLNDKIQAKKREAKMLQTKIDDLQARLDQDKSSFNTVDSDQTQNLESTVSDLQSQLVYLKEQNETIQSENAGLIQEIILTNELLEKKEDRVDSLTKLVEKLQSSQTSRQTEDDMNEITRQDLLNQLRDVKLMMDEQEKAMQSEKVQAAELLKLVDQLQAEVKRLQYFQPRSLTVPQNSP